ncbi:hypothetical protein [Noviherbaspirillum malthae]|uniref:hypothetical protein n=1 Tax=Noviherbaspirillum malthae TaxID=1260987 RepID=UPI00188F3852|nr:hypothetical protein [Noviherbaspirillum malthae]
MISTLVLVATKHVELDLLAFVALFLLFLTAINTLTLIQNVLGLIRLNALFNQLKHQQGK